jgi:hypothetical protein
MIITMERAMLFKQKPTQTNTALLIVLGCGLLLLSCNFLTEPEPFVNHVDTPSLSKPAVLSNIQPDQVLAPDTVVFFNFTLDKNLSNNNNWSGQYYKVSLVIESKAIQNCEGNIYDGGVCSFTLNTTGWTRGKHVLYFIIYFTDKSPWVHWSLQKIPTTYKTTLVFGS